MREALIWNFEDDNFTWMDASVDDAGVLDPIVCIKYQPDPGWQVRWTDLDNNTDVDDAWDPGTEGPLGDLAASWADLDNGIDAGGFTAGAVGSSPSRWSELTSGPAEENMYWLTADGLFIADQTAKTDGIKQYFVERQRLDLNDVVESFTTDKWIHAKQLYFHLMSPELVGAGTNDFRISVGWTDSLMDAPDYPTAATINLQSIINGGKVKYDFRSTGRYLALAMFFNTTADIHMTSAEIDAVQVYGR